MSGDAQPRKRKDKRKKKEDAAEEEIFISLKHATDEVIHVQKETGCGGNAYTKVIFFCLLATLGVMIGLILLEYRGSTDEETSSSVDSPWSLMFEDWIDRAPDIGHGEHSEEHDEGSHEEEHDEHEEEELDEDKDDEDNHEADEPGEEGQDDGGGGILSWMGLGGGKGEETETDEEGLLGWFGFGASDQGDEEVEEGKKSSSGWFGFGGSEDEEPQNDEQHVENEEQDEDDDKEMIDDFENEEEEEEEEEEDEVDDEEDDDAIENQGIEEEEEEIEEKQSLKEDEEEDEESEEKDDSIEDQSQEEMEEDDDDIVQDRDKYKEDEDEGIDQDEDELEEEEEEDEPIERLVTAKYKNEPKDQGNEDDEDEGIEEDDIHEQDDEEDNLSKEDDEDEYIEENMVGEAEEKTEYVSDQSFLETKNVEDDEKTYEGEKANDIVDEELFPEALAALKRESEELAAKESDEEIKVLGVKEEEEVTDSEGSSPGEEGDETEGMALKFGVGVALVVVAHVVLVKKWNSWGASGQEEIEVTTESKNLPGRDFGSGDSSGEKYWSPATETQPPPLQPTPSPRVEELPTLVAQEEPLEQSEGEEEMGEEEEDEEPEIDKQEFHSLLAKYGRDSPESSDLEPSDDEVQQVEYSEGEESVGEEEESPNEEEAVSEDDLKDWTGIQKTEVETPEETESEVEEEPSEDEEAPPPPPPQPQTRSRGGPRAHLEDYPYAHLTSDEDWTIRDDLDRADEELNYDKARPLYETILKKYPNSPRARYGYARTLDKEAELVKSNKVLNQAIAGYYHSLSTPNITDDLFITVAQRLINRLRFRGLYLKAVEIHRQLIERFPSTPEYKTDLGINYLMVNRLEDAGSVFEEVLCKWPEDPVALAHLGLVFKLQGRILKAIKYLQRGLADDMPFTRDARLYFHLGDALTRVGRIEEAMKLYERAVDNGLFRSVYQRSLYNVDRLTARPWWTPQQTTYQDFLRSLETNWEGIRDEGMKALKINGSYRDEAEGLRDKGDWKQFELFARGVKMKSNCEMTPLTCSILSSFEPVTSCRRGQSKFSVMEGGTHVWPHCGPTNCRLRAHLGLIVPQGLSLRVAHQTRSWKEGKVLVFDDSFEHEVWHNGTSLRLVLIVDFWHPELTPKERLSLSTI